MPHSDGAGEIDKVGEGVSEMRTAALSAAVTKYLAPNNARVLALLGSGVQAEWAALYDAGLVAQGKIGDQGRAIFFSVIFCRKPRSMSAATICAMKFWCALETTCPAGSSFGAWEGVTLAGSFSAAPQHWRIGRAPFPGVSFRSH